MTPSPLSHTILRVKRFSVLIPYSARKRLELEIHDAGSLGSHEPWARLLEKCGLSPCFPQNSSILSRLPMVKSQLQSRWFFRMHKGPGPLGWPRTSSDKKPPRARSQPRSSYTWVCFNMGASHVQKGNVVRAIFENSAAAPDQAKRQNRAYQGLALPPVLEAQPFATSMEVADAKSQTELKALAVGAGKVSSLWWRPFFPTLCSGFEGKIKAAQNVTDVW